MGERSNGKTYAWKKRCIDKFKNEGGIFIYLRRRKDQITRRFMKKLFEDMYDYCMDNLNDYIKYSVEDGFYIEDYEEHRTTIGYAMSVEDGTAQKGIPWNMVTTIFFDEFLEYAVPIEDEKSRFENAISTIVRKRENVEILMAANTVTKSSPYFELFNIDVKKMKQGEIVYIKHKKGATIALEYCRSANIIDGIKQNNKYLGFDDDPTSDMILYGEWEYDIVNTSEIDGIGWNCERMLIPIYLTSLGEVYEMSIYVSNDPILFVRKINTQNGEVRKEIMYNLSYDGSLKLINKNGIVPMYGKVTKLMGDSMNEYWDIIKDCLTSKRVVFDKISSGSDFMRCIKYML